MTIELLLYHIAYAGIAVLLTQSLNSVWKTGVLSLGHHGFFAVGAYVAAVVSLLFFPADPDWFVRTPVHRGLGVVAFTFSLGVGACAAGGIGWALITLCERARGDYIAVATLIFAELVRSVVENCTYVGGAVGFEVPYLAVTNSPNERLFFVGAFAAVTLTLNVVVYVAIRYLDNSVCGLQVSAIRNDDLAARFSGIEVERLRATIFTLAAAVAGATGVVFLYLATVVVPGDFSFVNGIFLVLYVILGSLDRSRCIVACVLMYATYEVLKLQLFGLLGPTLGQNIADWKEALLGILLVLSVTLPALTSRKVIVDA